VGKDDSAVTRAMGSRESIAIDAIVTKDIVIDVRGSRIIDMIRKAAVVIDLNAFKETVMSRVIMAIGRPVVDAAVDDFIVRATAENTVMGCVLQFRITNTDVVGISSEMDDLRNPA